MRLASVLETPMLSPAMQHPSGNGLAPHCAASWRQTATRRRYAGVSYFLAAAGKGAASAAAMAAASDAPAGRLIRPQAVAKSAHVSSKGFVRMYGSARRCQSMTMRRSSWRSVSRPKMAIRTPAGQSTEGSWQAAARNSARISCR